MHKFIFQGKLAWNRNDHFALEAEWFWSNSPNRMIPPGVFQENSYIWSNFKHLQLLSDTDNCHMNLQKKTIFRWRNIFQNRIYTYQTKRSWIHSKYSYWNCISGYRCHFWKSWKSNKSRSVRIVDNILAWDESSSRDIRSRWSSRSRTCQKRPQFFRRGTENFKIELTVFFILK